ncbi:MAG TPA: methyltransferase domain-containing protein [Vicinamibacterales bacterium]|nr:methyltransferase domain-containing protein [Vicinamibacterales bacterium]
MSQGAAREWDAASYHRVSGPQAAWGRRLLARLFVRGDERVIDAGCGTGRLTRELMGMLPRGRLIAIDRSWNMLLTARANLRPDFGPRISYVRVDLPMMPFGPWADLVFSTATFHWVRDHPRLFAEIWRSLRPAGRLFAQCGGGPNLVEAHRLADQVMRAEPFAAHFEDWSDVWEFSTAELAADRLRAAGFIDVAATLEPAATTLADEASYREFVTTVIYNPHLERLPTGPLRTRFIDEVTRLAAAQDPPFTLDYWRLNLEARRP